jgi:hypothetical protein
MSKKRSMDPIMVKGFEIVFEKKKIPKVNGNPNGKGTASVWDRVLDVIKPCDSFLIPYHRSWFGSFYMRAKKRKFKVGSRTEVHGPVKRLRIYRVK